MDIGLFTKMIIYEGKGVIDFSHKLSKMHKSALPNTVRFTLNDLAKDVKVKTLQEESKDQFQVRKPTFFKKYSGFQQAGGYNIAKMQSTVGMVKGGDSKSRASTDIAQQQTAGTVPNKSFMPTKNMRTGKGLVKKEYLTKINKKPIGLKGYKFGHKFGNNKIAGTRKSNFISRVIKAHNSNRPFLYYDGDYKGEGLIFDVTRLTMNTKKEFSFKLKRIATYQENRSIRLNKRKPFVINAATEAAKKGNDYYIRNAERQFRRFR